MLLVNIMCLLLLLGGNAGMAAAYVARKMGVPATIVIPSSSPRLIVQRLQHQGATVKIKGKVKCRCKSDHLVLMTVQTWSQKK